MRPALLLYVSLFAAVPAGGQDGLTLRLEPSHEEVTNRLLQIEVEAIGSEAGKAGAPVTKVRVRCPVLEPCPLDLSSDLEWTVQVRQAGWWSPGLKLDAGGRGEAVTLPLFRAAEVTGLLARPGGRGPLPERLGVRIVLPPVTPRERKVPELESEASCSVAPQGSFLCAVPAVPMDLRLLASPFAPSYFWGLVPHAGEATDLGRVELIEGASLSGWLRFEGSVPEGEVGKLRLSPAAQGTTPGVEALKRRAVEGDAEPSGFFQLRGLPAGAFVLRATLQGFGEGGLPAVILRQGEETQLRDPVVLQRPARLEVALSPSTDAYGKPWILRLVREDPHAHFLQTLAQGSPRENGTWKVGPVKTGEAALEVGDSQGSVWWEESVDLLPEANSLFVEIPLIPIEGTVSVGDDPVEGRLWFGGRRRIPNVVVELDEDGGFTGYLPREGLWDLDIEGLESLEQAVDPIGVKIPEGKSVAELEIRLPDTEIRGRVVDKDGEEIPDAQLILIGLREGKKKRREALLRTDREGAFLFRGVPPGRLHLRASKGKADSSWQELDLQEDFNLPEVILRLEELLAIEGRVTQGGAAVAGAAIFAKPRSQPSQRTTVTHADGGFRLDLWDEPTSLAVSAVGRGFTVLELSPRSAQSGPVEIRLPTTGGRLVLDVSGSFAAESGLETLRLLRGSANGPSISLMALLRDLRLPTGDELRRLKIEAAEPGDWAFCDGLGECVSGYLAPGGELVLGEDPPG